MENKHFIEFMKETIESAKLGGANVEINDSFGYIAVCPIANHEGYFFQGEDKDILEDEYEKSSVKDDFDLDEYLIFVSQGW